MDVDFDPFSHDHKQDPYPVYRALRDEAPVHYAGGSRSYTISRHADVQQVLTSPELFKSKTDRQRREAFANLGTFERLRLLLRFFGQMRVGPVRAARARMLIQEDGDVHALMRRIVNRGFSPRRISTWEERARNIVADCLAGVRARESFDLVAELAIPLPVTVIAELLGVEPERRNDFKRWSDSIVQGGTGSQMGDVLNNDLFGAMVELRRYLRPIVKARRAHPTGDLISTLVQAEGEASLSDYEVFLFVLLVLIAGNETTTNLLGNTVDALLEHPDQLARVVAEPALVPRLIEEALRYDTPVQFINRQATRDIELHGVTIPAGAQVVVLLGSANRDERHFPEPDRFDILRDTRGHLGFGFGAHFCLGASLARLEAKTALEALVPELGSLARVREEREFLDSYLIRGRARLELRR